MSDDLNQGLDVAVDATNGLRVGLIDPNTKG